MKKIISVFLAMLLLVSLAACGGPAEPAEDSPSAPPASDPGTTPSAGDDELIGAGMKIGFAQVHYTNAHRITQTESIIESFEALGFEVVWNEANKDTATQISNVNDLLAQDIDFLLIVPNEPEGLMSALNAANDAGVPVILIDRTANAVAGEDFITYVGPDFVWAGEECGNWIVDNYPDGANVVVVAGPAYSTGSIEHLEGFHSVVDGVDNIKILAEQTTDYSRTQGQSTMENFLQAHGDEIDIVFTESDELCFGVIQAMRTADYAPGKDIVIISAGDGSVGIVNEIANNTISVCVENTPRLGQQAAEAVAAYLKGEKIPGFIQAQNRVFTIDNAKAALDDGSTWG